jgi:hypothetical protein
MATVKKTSNYDPAQVILVVDGETISGYAAGTQLSITWNNDFWTDEVGNDGEDTRIKGNNFSALITCNLMQSSDSNDILSAIVNEDIINSNRIFEVRVRDLLGTTELSSSKCRLKRYADVNFANTGQPRPWRIYCPNLTGVVGGNTSI